MHLHLPNIHSEWPFPKAINPFFTTAAALSDSWTNSFRLFDVRQQAKFTKINGGLLSALCWPNHNLEHLRLACDLVNVLFACDDISDRLAGAEAESLARDMIDDIE